MKRAIEQELLAPLAMTTVTNDFPQGDQFLFVNEKGGQLKVDFVDPEEPNVNWKNKAQKVKTQKEKAESATLNQIILNPQGKLYERERILLEWKNLEESFDEKALEKRKSELMQKMAVEGFWDSEDRFDVLSDIEYLDRVENSLNSLESLLDRISNDEKPKLSYPPDLMSRIAGRIRLLQISMKAFEAKEIQDCFLKLECSDTSKQPQEALHSLEQLSDIYTKWGKARRMQLTPLLDGMDGSWTKLYWISGYGARQILQSEGGVHVWEQELPTKGEGKPKLSRSRLKVSVMPCKAHTTDPKELRKTFAELEKKESPSENEIVRTYKMGKSSLIKDHSRGWKTARIEQVLQGGFDVL